MFRKFGGRSRSFGFGGGSRQRRSFQPNRFAGAYIPPSLYIQPAQAPVQEEAYQAKYAFSDFGFETQLLANVERHSYTVPTPIQDQAIMPLMEGKDVIGISNTGTGKTAAFLLPLLNKLILDPSQGVLILAPTRELAVQISEELEAFAYHLPISFCLCIGGVNIEPQIKRLRQSPHFVIGTPGRIKDLLLRKAFDTAQFTNVVLDEVDRMLDIGFRPDITYLISKLPVKRHSAFFSATLNAQTDAVARAFLTDPVMIKIKNQENKLQIEQDIIKLKPGQNKIDVLHELLLQVEFKKVMVFGRTKRGINKLELVLSQRGLRVTSIHGNKNQNARQRSLQAFKSGRVQALLATDVAARGIDVDDVTHVINFDEPQSYDDYVHRIGRTGRAGKAGKALTFVL